MKNRLFELIQEKQQQERRIISASDVARESGVHRFTINNWLKGDISRVDEVTAIKLCQYFKCDLSELVYIEGLKES